MPEKLLNFKKKTTRQRALIMGLVLVVVANLYIQLIYKPTSRRLKAYKVQLQKAGGRLEELESKLPDLTGQRSHIETLSVEFKKVEDQIKEMEEALVSRGHTTQLLGELTNQASSLDIDFDSIRQRIDRHEGYSRFFVELKFNAPYRDIANYVRRLEAISPYLIVEEIDVSEPEKAGKAIAVRLVLSTLLSEAYAPEAFKAPSETPPVEMDREIFVPSKKPVSKARRAELKLMGVSWRGDKSTAIINNEVVRTGEKVDDLEVKQILPESVVLTDGVEDFVISIEH